jgi:hypothetical protein
MFGQNYICVMNSSDYKPVAVGAVDPAALSFAKNTSLRGNSGWSHNISQLTIAAVDGEDIGWQHSAQKFHYTRLSSDSEL